MRTTRLTQTISPFGVGSIIDVQGESLMAADISTWPIGSTRRIVSRRLELALGVAELRPLSVPSGFEEHPGIIRTPRAGVLPD